MFLSADAHTAQTPKYLHRCLHTCIWGEGGSGTCETDTHNNTDACVDPLAAEQRVFLVLCRYIAIDVWQGFMSMVLDKLLDL